MFKYLIPIFALTCISLQASQVADHCKQLIEEKKFIEAYELLNKMLDSDISIKERIELLEIKWITMWHLGELLKANEVYSEVQFLKRIYRDQLNN